MLQTNRPMPVVAALAASLLLAGCAADAIRTGSASKHYRHARSDRAVARKQAPAQVETGSIAKEPGPVTSKEDPRWRWCEQRHLDHQAGKAPGGATDLAKKLEDDRICAAVYERTAGAPPAANEGSSTPAAP